MANEAKEVAGLLENMSEKEQSVVLEIVKELAANNSFRSIANQECVIKEIFVEAFSKIKLRNEALREIDELTGYFVKQLEPVRIYLFGSYANNTFREDSDFDFYIVVRDDENSLVDASSKAYKAIRGKSRHSIDIVVGKESSFESKKKVPSLENEVYKKGVLLYEAGSQIMEMAF